MALDDQGGLPLVRLAAFLADPAAWIADDFGLLPDQRAMLAQSPVTRPVLNHWLAAQAGIAALGFDARFLAELEGEELQRALGLCLASRETLGATFRLFAAALWQDRLRLAVMKADREKLLAELGAEAMDFGLRRAPIFARALQDVAIARDTPAELAGVQLCGGVVERAHPALYALFRLRFPTLPVQAVALSEKQVQSAWAVVGLQGVAL